jgi:transposase
MTMFAGLDVLGKRTAMCGVEAEGKIAGPGRHTPLDDRRRLEAFSGQTRQGWTGERAVHAASLPRSRRFAIQWYAWTRAADALKSRRIKSDKADAFALAEMPRTGWFSRVHVKSIDSHKIKTLLGARDQLVKMKRSLGNQLRLLSRPFGVRLPSRVDAKKFAEAAYQATRDDPLMHAGIAALLEALASIEARVAKLDDQLKELARRNEIAWRLMSVPGVGPVTASLPRSRMWRGLRCKSLNLIHRSLSDFALHGTADMIGEAESILSRMWSTGSAGASAGALFHLAREGLSWRR